MRVRREAPEVSVGDVRAIQVRRMGGTLRGRFELPRALRPTRSQVWRVGPSFATSAPRHRPRSEIPSLATSTGGPQRLDIEFERHHRLNERVGFQNPRVDLPESSNLTAVNHDGCRATRIEVRVLNPVDVRVLTDVLPQAEDTR